jgi:NitT/TauT family transport system ATP-binding protein
MDAIVIEHISKAYRRNDLTVAALENLSLRVENGEIVALVGPSGCGKSTLLRLIAGLDQPDAGQIRIFGKTTDTARKARLTGIVFQSPVLFAWRNAEENVALPMETAGIARSIRIKRARELLQTVGLADFADAYPSQLSGGMQQRVAIARALALEPALLLMDEPFSALDELTREQLQADLLTTLRHTERRATLLFATHNLAEAAFLADRVVTLTPRPGRLIGETLITLNRPRTPAMRDEPSFHEAVTRIRTLLQAA